MYIDSLQASQGIRLATPRPDLATVTFNSGSGSIETIVAVYDFDYIL